MSAASAKKMRERRLAEGGRDVRVVLTADAAAALTRLQSASGMSAAQVIEAAVILADRAQLKREKKEGHHV